jgi:hypothetical protein
MGDTGPSSAVRQFVIEREGHCCRRCGQWVADGAGSIHHRRPRQMGGTDWPGINLPSNLALICGSGTTGCHGYIESHRPEAYAMGWLVHSWEDPAEVPWQHPVLGVTY